MKKLLIASVIAAMSMSAGAQDTGAVAAGTTGTVASGVGGLTISLVGGGIIAASVVAAIVSANGGVTLEEGDEVTLTCNPTDAPPVDGVCTTTTTTVTGTGTGTATGTTTATVTVTYPAIINQ